MKRIPIGLIVAFVIVVVFPMGFAMLYERVEPMDIGVRQTRWGAGGINAPGNRAPGK